MDLIFKRYSSPFSLVDTLIQNNQFQSFIDELLEFDKEDKIYELWLHKVIDKEYAEFRSQFDTTPTNDEKVNVDEVLEKSMSVLNDIKPS